MNLINADEIVVEDRFRKEFNEEKLKDLVTSIARIGLIQLPVLDGNRLVAGERRLRAMKELHASQTEFTCLGKRIPPYQVPYLNIEDVDPITRKEIELEENVQRADLTWQERVDAVANLHRLRNLQSPARDHTVADTAEELKERGTPGADAQTVRNRIILAEHLNEPEIAKAASEKDALKALRKKIENEFLLAAANGVGEDKTEHQLWNVSAEVGLDRMEEPFDVMVTDPPYGIDADKFSLHTRTETHAYSDSEKQALDVIENMVGALNKHAKAQAHAYVFCDFTKFFEIACFFEDAGWVVWPRPLIWVKDSGHVPRATHGPSRNYECILFANRGDKMVNALYRDVLEYPNVKDKKHAAEKPIDLYIDLLKRSATPGDVVVDPFCGSGPIFPAADELKCKAYGFDSDPTAIGLARRWL